MTPQDEQRRREAVSMPPILDVACGSRMFYFDKKNPLVLFGDKRKETHVLKDSSSKGGSRYLEINPDMQLDFTKLPFKSDTFSLVVFDPPHLVNNGKNGWLAKKYGKLGRDWRAEIAAGFSECFRVLKPCGTLIFKWNETDIGLPKILALTSEKPLFGNQCGKRSASHWLVFMKVSP